MTPEQAKALRERFPDTAVGHIIKGGVRLAYVGHAATTDRLLSVDPAWTWEPVAVDERGLPLLDEHGGLWIRLTVAGVTRLGYGDAGGKKGPNAVKEAIGDALRNAAMRFGVALDLWAKEEFGDSQPEPAKAPSKPRPEPKASPAAQQLLDDMGKATDAADLEILAARINATAGLTEMDLARLRKAYGEAKSRVTGGAA